MAARSTGISPRHLPDRWERAHTPLRRYRAWAQPGDSIPGVLSRLEEDIASAGLTLTDTELTRLNSLPVVGKREAPTDRNWSYGVTPPLN